MSTFPKVSETELTLPYVLKQYRNINLFPILEEPIRLSIKTDLLSADRQC